MKTKYNIKQLIGVASIALFFGTSCSDILDEQPRSIYDPSFLSTERGIEGGITSMYAHLRYIYGQAYYYNSCLTGTDEATYGSDADANFKDNDYSGVGNLTATSSRSDAIWGICFTNINTANGVIENGTQMNIDKELLAEAYFFRGFDYFLLVQTFGGVPLDLGSGELKFNVSPSRVSVRNTVTEVYSKAIFPDLVKALEDLPENPRVIGGVTKNVARLYLSKAYLTYAWWLENPKNIPTYPECQRVDPDGHDAAWYYQQAYDLAVYAINNKGPYDLMPTFYDVNVGTNDRNKEIMLYADHTQEDEYYNGGSLSYGSGAAPDNFAGWMMNWNYTVTTCKADDGKYINPLRRVAEQAYGRPWTRMCPTYEVIANTFKDKVNDSRYDGTFVTRYRANWPKEGLKNEYVLGPNGDKLYVGDVILTFLDDEPSGAITYPSVDEMADKNKEANLGAAIGAGTLAGESSYVVSPMAISRRVYPALWKLGPYRTDNGDGPGQPNAGSTRPYNIAKFSEFYLLAAEALVQGANATDPNWTKTNLVNVLRKRAGVWKFSNADNKAVSYDYSSNMVANTPSESDINIKYILEERSREFYGEGYRWYDLVRTQMWNEMAGTYSICGSAYGDHELKTYTRTIKPEHYLRPIPQSQLDALTMTEAEKDAYQNPGYRD